MEKFTLENDHNVYIIGAGFSVGAGYPVMRDFFARMRDSLEWLVQQRRFYECSAIEAVLEFRLRGASAAYRTPLDLENIEELFSLASASGDTQLPAYMQVAIAATLDYCAKTVGQTQPVGTPVVLSPDSPLRSTLDPTQWPQADAEAFRFVEGFSYLRVHQMRTLTSSLVGQFSEPSKQRKNTFITFNYDLLLEESLTQGGLQVDYGIGADAISTSTPWLHETGIKVYKLHGSVNWSLPSDKNGLLIINDRYDPLTEVSPIPFVVPPTWRKDFGAPLATVWNSALRALRTATRIVVIGFSIPETDQHFRYLLAAGMRDNISLRQVLFVDPAVESLKARIARILRPQLVAEGTVRLVPRTAIELVNAEQLRQIGRPLAQHVLTPH
jgi:hypothetical protein